MDLKTIIIITFILNLATEVPKMSVSEGKDMYDEKMPMNSSNLNTKEIQQLAKFCLEVEFIIFTINDNEYHAAACLIETPAENFNRAVFYPKANMVVGMFAMKKSAVIQTDVGVNCDSFIKEAIDTFPNAHFVFGVGVCYAFDREKYKLGDVLVSKQICDLTNSKFKKNGKIENRGQTIDVHDDLKRLFCMDLVSDFEVTDKRKSEVHSGQMASLPNLMDNKVMRNKLQTALPTAIGGEMEGGQLLKFQRKRNIKGVIVIKGVVDYGDGTKTKEWQFTAAMAALHYTKFKLLRVAYLTSERE